MVRRVAMGKSSFLQASFPEILVKKKGLQPCDLEFLINTPLLDSMTPEAEYPLLNASNRKQVRMGERFISQGDEGDKLYIIQDGTCTISVDKDQENYPIARLSGGDIVGEIALLTGVHRTANVDAETDMTLWCLILQRHLAQ